jgi:hypothetical protein
MMCFFALQKDGDARFLMRLKKHHFAQKLKPHPKILGNLFP